ncbi:antitoxin [Pseudonocardia sp. CA-142604]|uniref:antitoxin n=1 Tax=Pseudonocardia sp. CA-142604 TaxID=3240024 RepID=UPI003D8FA848
MGLMEKIRELLHQHDDKVDQGIEKAGEMAKTKVEGHDQQIDQAVDKLQQMTGDGDTTEPKPPGESPPGSPPQGAGGQEPPPPR